MKRVCLVVGARPNFIKIANLISQLNRSDCIDYLLINTGQHYDQNLAGIFFEELGIPQAHVNLNVESAPRDEQIATIKKRLLPVFKEYRIDLVIVVGDVNSTLAAAEAAHMLCIKVAHIEAGLRSFDLSMPEEINRIETDKISDYLFVTEDAAIENLRREGQPAERIFLVGNLMIDTLIKHLKTIKLGKTYKEFGLETGAYAVATFHRPANVDTPEALGKVLKILKQIATKITILWPVHPRTRSSLEKFELLSELAGSNIILASPLGYFEFINLVFHSSFVLTDSGGIQEETSYLGIPCLTLRENTERPITISAGTNMLVGSDSAKIIKNVNKILHGGWQKPQQTIPLWDGKAAERICNILERKLQ